ncbi:MAG: type II toxin-antitoxin system RatA family toxin [Pseudomonadota bacterium]
MPKHSETRILPWTAGQMFDLVADVGRYGEFLPWVSAVRIRSNSDYEMTADVIVGFKGLRENFTSRVAKTRPTSIKVDYVDGPLKFLRNEWYFSDRPEGGCNIDFAVDFAFKSKIFEALAGQVFERALNKMTDAFVARAEVLYGSVPGISNSSATSAA